MASPQLEDGYLRIANELVDAFARNRFSGQEYQVIWAIIRKTYGFSKKEDFISHGQISKMTGLPRTRVVMIVNSLVSKMVLGSLKNGTRQPSTIWINKNFEQWCPSPKKETSPNIGTTPSPNIETKPSPNIGTHKRQYKDNIKTKTPLPPLPDWMNVETWGFFCEHRKSIKKPMTPQAQKLMFQKLEKLESEGNPHVAVLNQSIENGWTGVFPIKKNGQHEEPKTVEQELMARGYKNCNHRSIQ